MDSKVLESLDNEIETKRAQIDSLRHELATLLEARRILSGTANRTAGGSAPERRPTTSTSNRRTIVDDILRVLSLTDRAMTPIEIRGELVKIGRDVPQPVVTSTLNRLHKAHRVWRVGPAQYAAQRNNPIPLNTTRTLLMDADGESGELSVPITTEENQSSNGQ
jgi:hypothetical protein